MGCFMNLSGDTRPGLLAGNSLGSQREKADGVGTIPDGRVGGIFPGFFPAVCAALRGGGLGRRFAVDGDSFANENAAEVIEGAAHEPALEFGAVMHVGFEEPAVVLLARAAHERADGGKGGGKTDMAQGGGTQPEKLGDALEQSYAVIERLLSASA